jgi:hypothetical protein
MPQVLLVPLDSTHRAAVRFRADPVVLAGAFDPATSTLVRVGSTDPDDGDFGGLLLWKLAAATHTVQSYYALAVDVGALASSPAPRV